MIMNLSRQTILYRLPLVGYCVFIFVQSSFATPDVLPAFAYSDKMMHLGGYALLGALAVRALKREFVLAPKLLIVAGAILFSTLYGLSDEVHQSFVSERSAEGWDVLADFFGSIVGATLFYRDLPWIDRDERGM